MSNNIELSQIMSARLYHDLAGPIGTIDNCFSLFDHKNKNICKKAKILAFEESRHLVSKINFFRSVYGIFDGEIDMNLVFIKKLLTNFFINTKLNLQLHFDENLVYIDAQLAKASICLVAILVENIHYSGEINFYLNKDKNQPVELFGKSNSLMSQDESLEMLEDKLGESVNIRNCREYYVNQI